MPGLDHRVKIGSPDEWAEMSRTSDVPVTTYQVLGERSSGTNYVDKLVGQNFDVRSENLFQWKHGYPITHFIPRSALVIVCFREPIDWLASMHRKPWHAPDHFWNMPYSEFLRAPWHTQVDDWTVRDDLRELRRLEHPARYLAGRFWNHFIRDRFPIHRGWVKASDQVHKSAFGLALQHDRHPVDGTVFANILQLRNAKTRGFLSLRNRGCNHVFVRFEVVRENPEAFLAALGKEFDLAVQKTFTPVDKWMGTLPDNQKPQTGTTKTAPSADDLAFIRRELDHEIEREVGYLTSIDGPNKSP